jgi:hypothetical protein
MQNSAICVLQSTFPSVFPWAVSPRVERRKSNCFPLLAVNVFALICGLLAQVWKLRARAHAKSQPATNTAQEKTPPLVVFRARKTRAPFARGRFHFRRKFQEEIKSASAQKSVTQLSREKIHFVASELPAERLSA